MIINVLNRIKLKELVCIECGKIIKGMPTCDLLGSPFCDFECLHKGKMHPAVRRAQRRMDEHSPRSILLPMEKLSRLREKHNLWRGWVK